ncbi:methyltransferase [Candidatus Woesearchaeota archaeon]|nr:methyltransferase [Candidatus Woesearchaeota archaeon]
MVSIISKSGIAITLSKLEGFPRPDARLEQYQTPSEMAAEVLWQAHMAGRIAGKRCADPACGPGIIGIGMLLLGAAHVHFIDKDRRILAVLRRNLASLGIGSGYTVHATGIGEFCEQVDCVVQNPPFGTRAKHIDTFFLERAFAAAPVVYSFHKTSTESHILTLAEKTGFSCESRTFYSFPLPASMPHHRKRTERIAVTCFCFVKAKGF